MPWSRACLRRRPGALGILDANGLDAAGEEIILRREVTATGKARVFVNNQPATVSVLQALAPELALVHAQSDSLGAFDQAQQRSLLDRSAAISEEPVRAAFTQWSKLRAKLASLQTDEQDRLRMADLWRFQAREIDQAQLEARRRRNAAGGKARAGERGKTLRRSAGCARRAV